MKFSHRYEDFAFFSRNCKPSCINFADYHEEYR